MTMKSVDERIGARVKQLRVEKKMSLEAAAKAAELSLDAYEAREDGEAKFSVGELWALATALHVPFEELFRGIISTSDELAAKRH